MSCDAAPPHNGMDAFAMVVSMVSRIIAAVIPVDVDKLLAEINKKTQSKTEAKSPEDL